MGLIGSEWMPTHFTDVKTLSVTANKIRGLCTWSLLTKTRTKAKTKTTLLLTENALSVFSLGEQNVILTLFTRTMVCPRLGN